MAYSCASNFLEAVRLMLEADSALYASYNVDLKDEQNVVYEKVVKKKKSVLEIAIEHSTGEIVNHLQIALKDRRSRLMSLAITQLCHDDLQTLNITDDRLLDEKAFDVYEALERRNVVIPSALRVPSYRTTVYHQILPPAINESFYRCGFIDVDGIDYFGFTPLMKLEDPRMYRFNCPLQRASWLISKGADPRRRTEQGLVLRLGLNTTATHYLCSWIGIAAAQEFRDDRSLVFERTQTIRELKESGEDSPLLLGKLLSVKLYDNCVCACSNQGCTPITMLLKNMSLWTSKWEPPIGQSSLLILLDYRAWLTEWFTKLRVHRHKIWQWLSQEIIRYETFVKLELTHTCCKVNGSLGYHILPRYDSTERKEIRHEERFLISKLETLVAEFTEKYTELGVSLPDFLKGYWKTRMEEVEREEEPLDDEEIAKIRELGVVIHS